MRKLQRTKKNTKAELMRKKIGAENQKFYLDMFSLKLRRVPGFDVLTLDSWWVKLSRNAQPKRRLCWRSQNVKS